MCGDKTEVGGSDAAKARKPASSRLETARASSAVAMMVQATSSG